MAWASPAVPKRYAALLTGPPRSKHIMRPMMTPRRTPAPLSAMEVREPVSQLMKEASGLPSSMYMIEPATAVVHSGMMTTGMRLRSQRGAFRPESQAAM